RRPRDRAIGTGVDEAVRPPVGEGGTDHQAHRRQGHEDRPDLHPASSLSRSRIPYVKPSKKAAKTGRQFSPELRPIERRSNERTAGTPKGPGSRRGPFCALWFLAYSSQLMTVSPASTRQVSVLFPPSAVSSPETLSRVLTKSLPLSPSTVSSPWPP